MHTQLSTWFCVVTPPHGRLQIIRKPWPAESDMARHSLPTLITRPIFKLSIWKDGPDTGALHVQDGISRSRQATILGRAVEMGVSQQTKTLTPENNERVMASVRERASSGPPDPVSLLLCLGRAKKGVSKLTAYIVHNFPSNLINQLRQKHHCPKEEDICLYKVN